MREIAEMMLTEARHRLAEMLADAERGEQVARVDTAKVRGAIEALECLLAKC